jgi:hypothetical protein
MSAPLMLLADIPDTFSSASLKHQYKQTLPKKMFGCVAKSFRKLKLQQNSPSMRVLSPVLKDLVKPISIVIGFGSYNSFFLNLQKRKLIRLHSNYF